MSIPSHIPSLPKHTSDMISLVADPYHDYNLKPTGYPDGLSTMSAVMRKSLRQTVSCPFALTVGQSWDFHIFTTPLHDIETYKAYVIVGNTFNVIGQPSADLGTINILYRHYDPAGAQLAQVLVNLPFTYGGAEKPSASARTVSLAFELHNTTAELYKSGSVTAYRTPSLSIPTHGFLDDSTPTPIPFAGQVISNIPEDLAQAVALPNSRTWSAKEGAYCVSLPYPNNLYSTSMPQNLVLTFGSGANGYLRHITYNSRNTSSFSPISSAGLHSDKFVDANQTFTLDARQILEVVPSVSISDPYLPFAGTAPRCDELFLKLYREMFNTIPPGTPVRNNASGDWFRQLIMIAKSALPLIASALPGQAKIVAQAALPFIDSAITKAIQRKAEAQPVRNTTQRLTSQQQPKKKKLIKK